MGGIMRFVNRLCQPVAMIVEVANGRRTTAVVVSIQDIHPGKEISRAQRRSCELLATFQDRCELVATKASPWQAADAAKLSSSFTFGFAPPSASAPPRFRPPLPMPKHSGTTNYSMANGDRLLALVEKMLPLGRDE
ncbi:hypothetical protein PR001_g25256 [Phytophthora rubi]|uniref:Uncharacterized protein n=3 Tax=Phytophthora TaxID=4783 RepID=A0A6A3I5J7_9STRA|nr:hypothetical protein PR001_g25256 [Phytophthora rubi]